MNVTARHFKIFLGKNKLKIIAWFLFVGFWIILFSHKPKDPISLQGSDLPEYAEEIFHLDGEMNIDPEEPGDKVIAIDPVKLLPPQYSKDLKPLPEEFVDYGSCPACLGNDFCEEIMDGLVKVIIPNTPDSLSKDGFYFGALGRKGVMIKTFYGSSQSRRFNDFICKNMTNQADCHVSQTIKNSFVTKESAFRVEALKTAYITAHDHPREAMSTLCNTHGSIEQMEEAVEQTRKVLSSEDRAMLYMATVVHPDVSNYRLLAKDSGWPFPTIIGTCGYVMVLEHFGRPLDSFLSAPWETRAELAAQILHIINHFVNADSAFYMMHTSVTYDAFHVQEDEMRVVVVNARDLALIDRDSATEYLGPEDSYTCNEDCFKEYQQHLFDVTSPNQEHQGCVRSISIGSHQMYAQLCKEVLSDLPKHISASKQRSERHPGQGLLHDIPSKHQHVVWEALEECVHETAPGSRMLAVEDLQEIMGQYALEGR